MRHATGGLVLLQIATICLLASSQGCAQYQPIHKSHPLDPPPSIEVRGPDGAGPSVFVDRYFLEFDDQGFLWKPELVSEVERRIGEIRNAGESPLVLLFVHGYMHDASLKKGSYASRFEQEVLARFAEYENRVPKRQVIGIFVGWTGDTWKVPVWSRVVGFFARYAAAVRIGNGPDLADAISRIGAAAGLHQRAEDHRDRPIGVVVLGAHSAGSAMLHEAYSRLLVAEAAAVRSSTEGPLGKIEFEKTLLPDFVFFLNSAANSLQHVKLLIQLRRAQVERTRRINDCDLQLPLIVSVTSETDRTTRVIYRVSRKLEMYPGKKRSEHSALPKDPLFSGLTYSQREYFKFTEGHNPELITHEIVRAAIEQCDGSGAGVMSVGREGVRSISLRAVSSHRSTSDSREELCLRPARSKEGGPAPIRGPAWVVRASNGVLGGHGAIFTDEALDIMSGFVNLTLFDTLPSSGTCSTEPGASPDSRAGRRN